MILGNPKSERSPDIDVQKIAYISHLPGDLGIKIRLHKLLQIEIDSAKASSYGHTRPKLQNQNLLKFSSEVSDQTFGLVRNEPFFENFA